MLINGKKFENHTYIMGILNVTPDSFSDGGVHNTLDSALYHAEKMARDGADIIDVGGESTRPNYTKISDDEEIERVVPIIERITKEIDLPVSIDTYKSAVADAALGAGASLVNDIWGFKYDDRMAQIVKKHNASCCLMHNRTNAEYVNFIDEVLADLQKSINIALDAGIDKSMIMTDPGVGFAKSLEQNLEITNKMDMLSGLGYPFLLGTSRKSMIGLTLDLPIDERLEGTLATTALAVVKGALFVRVHDVKENYRTIKMMEAILSKK